MACDVLVNKEVCRKDCIEIIEKYECEYTECICNDKCDCKCIQLNEFVNALKKIVLSGLVDDCIDKLVKSIISHKSLEGIYKYCIRFISVGKNEEYHIIDYADVYESIHKYKFDNIG